MDIEFEALLARPGAHERAVLVRRFGRAALDNAVRAGAAVPIARGLYAGVHHVDSLWTSAEALVLACGGDAALTGCAALAARGCLREWPERALVVTRSPTRVRRPVARARLLRTVHPFEATLIDRIDVTAPHVALLHAVGEVGAERARAIALEALASGIVDVGSAVQMARERRFRGRRVLVEAVAAFDAGVRSILEHEGKETVLTGPMFAGLLRQHSITVQGRRMDIDAYDQDCRVAFEFDGVAFHTSVERWQRDRERDTLLASVGIQTVRFTTRDIRERPDWCRERALEICAQRRRLLAA